MLPHNKCVKKRATKDPESHALSVAEGRRRQRVSHSHEKSFCFLLLKLAENRNRARASETEMHSGVWNAGFPCPSSTFPRWDETPGSWLFLSCWLDSSRLGIHSSLNGVDSLYSLYSAPHGSVQVLEQRGLVLSKEQSQSTAPLGFTGSASEEACSTYSEGKCACKVISASSVVAETIAVGGLNPSILFWMHKSFDHRSQMCDLSFLL